MDRPNVKADPGNRVPHGVSASIEALNESVNKPLSSYGVLSGGQRARDPELTVRGSKPRTASYRKTGEHAAVQAIGPQVPDVCPSQHSTCEDQNQHEWEALWAGIGVAVFLSGGLYYLAFELWKVLR